MSIKKFHQEAGIAHDHEGTLYRTSKQISTATINTSTKQKMS